jgi:hypothetical protein
MALLGSKLIHLFWSFVRSSGIPVSTIVWAILKRFCFVWDPAFPHIEKRADCGWCVCVLRVCTYVCVLCVLAAVCVGARVVAAVCVLTTCVCDFV